MVIGVISDTHRQHKMIKEAIDELRETDMIIHLGDNVEDVEEISKYYKRKIISVKGNCDFNVSLPSEIIEIIDKKRFFITHGHNYGVKNDLTRLKYKALEVGADIVLFGHTHVAQIVQDEGVWFFNPGSASLSRKGPNSVGIIEIKNGNIDIKMKNL